MTKKQVLMKLANPQQLLGHCQVTYTSKNELSQKLVYCLQDNGPNHGGIRLMRCTQEGEPNYEVKFTEVEAIFEKPMGDDKLFELCRAWIEKNGGKS